MHKNIKYFILYFLLAVVAYWQVSFFQNTLKWDMVDCYLPWRSFVSECIEHGYFPFWNPYQNFGYPIHADMRSIWSPEVWLITLFGGYSIYTFHILFIVYTTTAGIGMFYLSKIFTKNEKAAFFAGAVYMLSGYLTAHGQEIYTINSFAFIPIVLYQFITLFTELSVKRAVYLTLFLFVILTSAYQAHSFILLYLFIIITIHFFINWYKQKKIKEIKRLSLLMTVVALVIVIIFIPYLISAKQVLPQVSRLNSGVDVSTVSKLSFSPQSLLSLILPFGVIRDIKFFNTDLSMTNMYFGIISLVYLLLFFFKKHKNTLFSIILIFGIISLIASFGAYTPLRELLFNYVPFMNLFKGSAYFRLFALIAFCIASSIAFNRAEKSKKLILALALLLLVVIIGFMAKAFPNIYFKENSFINGAYSLTEVFEKKSSFSENIFLQGLIQIAFLFAFIMLIIYKKANQNIIIGLALINMVIAVQLNIYATTVSKYKPAKIHKYVKSLPQGFPIPENKPINTFTDKSASCAPLWRNTSMLAKQVSGDSFNSFRLDKTAELKSTHKTLKDTVTQNHLMYLSNNIKPLSDLYTKPVLKNELYINDSLYKRLVSYCDTNEIINSNIRITDFGPNHIEAQAIVEDSCLLTFIQTNYPGWEAEINSKATDIIESNTVFMSILVPKGTNTIRFQYKNSQVFKTFIISAIFVITTIILSLIFWVNDSKKHFKQKKLSC